MNLDVNQHTESHNTDCGPRVTQKGISSIEIYFEPGESDTPEAVEFIKQVAALYLETALKLSRKPKV